MTNRRRDIFGIAAGGFAAAGLPATVGVGLQTALNPDLAGSGALDRTGVRDNTRAFNSWSASATGYSLGLSVAIQVPDGRFRIGAGNGTVFIRKGQTLTGSGFGSTTLDLSQSVDNTRSVVRLGASNGGTVDPGGQAVEISQMTVLGGPARHGAVDVSDIAGWKVQDVFFAAPGIGVQAGGGDGMLTNCIFDQGLTHISAARLANAIISNNIHYGGNYSVILRSQVRDVTFVGNQYEYFHYCAVLLDVNESDIRNVAFSYCNFIQSVQHETTLGGVYLSASHADVSFMSCRFRNIRGFGFAYGTGVKNRVLISGCVFDGERTSDQYNQSSTMGGVDATNTEMTIRNTSFRNLPGQPILFGGDEAATLRVQACDFQANRGGRSEILITNTNPASRVVIVGCIGGGRPLVNDQGVVPVIVLESVD